MSYEIYKITFPNKKNTFFIAPDGMDETTAYACATEYAEKLIERNIMPRGEMFGITKMPNPEELTILTCNLNMSQWKIVCYAMKLYENHHGGAADGDYNKKIKAILKSMDEQLGRFFKGNIFNE